MTIVRSIPETQLGKPDNAPIKIPLSIAQRIPTPKHIIIDGIFLKSAPSAKNRSNTINSIQL
ncbi:hypothetical protein D3C81_1769460 [compost metagenome]